MFNASSGLCINLHYLFIYVGPLFRILGCNILYYNIIYMGSLFRILGCNEHVCDVF